MLGSGSGAVGEPVICGLRSKDCAFVFARKPRAPGKERPPAPTRRRQAQGPCSDDRLDRNLQPSLQLLVVFGPLKNCAHLLQHFTHPLAHLAILRQGLVLLDILCHGSEPGVDLLFGYAVQRLVELAHVVLPRQSNGSLGFGRLRSRSCLLLDPEIRTGRFWHCKFLQTMRAPATEIADAAAWRSDYLPDWRSSSLITSCICRPVGVDAFSPAREAPSRCMLVKNLLTLICSRIFAY